MHDQKLIKHLSNLSSHAALVIVTETKGHASRHTGSKMVVFADGTSLGTVGGGDLEMGAITSAIEHIANRTSGRIFAETLGEQAIGKDPICGGTISLAICLVSDKTPFARATEQLEKGKGVVIVYSYDGEQLGNVLAVIDTDKNAVYGDKDLCDDTMIQSVIASGAPAIASTGALLYDPILPQERLLILGGGHVGQALARFADLLDFHICIGDSRQEFVTPDRFPAGAEIRIGDFADIVDAYPCDRSTYIVVVSPSHSSDLACVRSVLKQEYRYAGFIGSTRKVKMILDQLIAEGFPKEKVLALNAPIGADIGAETPEEIAVAIVAEMIAVRRNSTKIKDYIGKKVIDC